MNFASIAKAVEKARHITIVGHLNPDADTIGTGLGLWWCLKEAGKRVDLFNGSEPLPHLLSFLPGYGKIRREVAPGTDLVIAVDCGSFDRLGIDPSKNVVLVNIDHHVSNRGYGDYNLIDSDASCAAEVAFALCVAAGWEIPKQSATCFYTALVSDTGFFGYESVDAEVFEFAQQLVKLGADPWWIARMLRENEPLCKLRLLPKVLQTLTLYLGGRVAGLEITRSMLRESGATVNETEDFVNYARSLATVEVGFLMREEPDGSLKASLRSKQHVDVARIACDFGGGGHQRAAGFTVREMGKEEVLMKLLKKIEEELQS